MQFENWFRRLSVVAIVMGLWGIAQPARADPFAVAGSFSTNEDPNGNLFGRLGNEDCGFGGICAGVSAINSFIYLESRYPDIYGNLLTPNRDPFEDPQGQLDSADSRMFAGCQTCGIQGWQDPANPGPGHNDDNPPAPQDDLGYYNRFGPNAAFPNLPQPAPGADANTLYMDTKMDWFNDFAPGTTTFGMFVNNGANGQGMFNFLRNELIAGEDIEFFVKDIASEAEEAQEADDCVAAQVANPNLVCGETEPPNEAPEAENGEDFYHAMTITGMACDANGNCTLNFIDPNGPTVYTGVPITLVDGTIEFTSNVHFDSVTGDSLANFPLFIDAAFSESPVPEPSTLFLLGTGVVAAAWSRRKVRVRKS